LTLDKDADNLGSDEDELGNLMKMLREAGFFNVDDDREDWVLLLPVNHLCTIMLLLLPVKYFG